MPYHIVAVRGGYYVESVRKNPETGHGRRYSKEPIPYEKAVKQLYALWLNHAF